MRCADGVRTWIHFPPGGKHKKCFLFFEEQPTLESVYRFGSLHTHVIHVYVGSWFGVVYLKQTTIIFLTGFHRLVDLFRLQDK